MSAGSTTQFLFRPDGRYSIQGASYMAFSDLFMRRPKASVAVPPSGLDVEKAAYIAGLVANLINRAAAARGFRGAVPAHPQMTSTSADVKRDEGARKDYGLTVTATTTRATITVSAADAQRLGFMAFAPVHKQIHGFDPDWRFDDEMAAMTSCCTLLGLPFRVACLDNKDGSASISLTISAQ